MRTSFASRISNHASLSSRTSFPRVSSKIFGGKKKEGRKEAVATQSNDIKGSRFWKEVNDSWRKSDDLRFHVLCTLSLELESRPSFPNVTFAIRFSRNGRRWTDFLRNWTTGMRRTCSSIDFLGSFPLSSWVFPIEKSTFRRRSANLLITSKSIFPFYFRCSPTFHRRNSPHLENINLPLA